MSTPKHYRGLADMLTTAEAVNLENHDVPGWLSARAMSTGSTRVILLDTATAEHIASILNGLADGAEAEEPVE